MTNSTLPCASEPQFVEAHSMPPDFQREGLPYHKYQRNFPPFAGLKFLSSLSRPEIVANHSISGACGQVKIVINTKSIKYYVKDYG